MGKWYEEAVFYHIYPLGLTGAPLTNEDRANGTVTHRLRELDSYLEHISAMGCGAIYIGPLFESSTHGYDTIDYRTLDSRLGDNQDLCAFVQKAHGMGLKIVVDGVFNHTGREFFAFEDIRRNRENSPYRWWYKGINFDWDSAYQDGFSYESWRNCGALVNLNLQNREVKDYLFDVIRFWIHTFDIDGIRLDCADVLDFDFMKEMRWITGQEKEDFWLMGEVIHGDYSRWANPQMLHSVTNYELHKGLFSGHNDHNYFEIAHTIRRQSDENGGLYRGLSLYNFVDNHDVARLASKLREKDNIRPVYTLLYTLPGLPSIYYGSEWGIEGRKEDGDAALRPAVDPAQMEAHPPVPGLCEYLAFLGECRKKYAALRCGAYRELLLTTTQYAFARILGDEMVVVVLNNTAQEADLWIRIPGGGRQMKDACTKEAAEPEYDQLHIRLEGYGCRLFV